jgi:signal transduction histidine kinase
MVWKKIAKSFDLSDTSTLGVAVQRESLRLRSEQSVQSRNVVLVATLIILLSTYGTVPLWRILAVVVPLAAMAVLTERVSLRVLRDIAQANVVQLAALLRTTWFTTIGNQLVVGSMVWWLGWQTEPEIATVTTSLQMIYLGAALVNASTNPASFVPGAWINITLTATFWATQGLTGATIALAMAGTGLLFTRFSRQMAANLTTSVAMRFENLDLLQRLNHEKSQAEATTRFKSDLLANVGHEIRTPVSTIAGMSYLVLKTDLDARQREMVQIIEQGSQHLSGLINQVMDLSRADARMLVLEHAAFDLQSVLDEAWVLSLDQAKFRGLRVVFSVEDGIPIRLTGDALRLKEILINYISNAIKFTQEGEIAVRVAQRRRDGARICLYFEVQDAGIGLTPEQMGRLFQSFQQADDSVGKRYGGSGLGLAISKKLAELMDGEVGVVSALGHGSTFWFTAQFGNELTPSSQTGLLRTPV